MSYDFKPNAILCVLPLCKCISKYLSMSDELGWALFVTYTIMQSIMRSEMSSLHLTHPSAHTWSSGQPTVQCPPSSRGLPAGAGIRTHNLGLPRVSSPTLYPLGQRLPEMQCLQSRNYFCLFSSFELLVFQKANRHCLNGFISYFRSFSFSREKLKKSKESRTFSHIQ